MTTRAMTLDRSAEAQAGTATRPAPRFVDLLQMEFIKTLRRRMTHVIFAIMALMVAGLLSLGYLVVFVFESNPDAEITDVLLPRVLEDGFEIIAMLGPILIAILAAGMAGSEFSWGTMRTMVGSGVPRARLLLAKLSVLAVASLLLVITGAVALAGVSTGISVIEGYGLRLSWLDLSTGYDVMLMLARTTFLLLVIAGLSFSIAQHFRSVAAGIAIGIGIMVFGPILAELAGLIGNIGETLNDYVITSAMSTIVSLNTFEAREIPPVLPGPWEAAATLALYAVIPIGLALWSFRRRDITVD